MLLEPLPATICIDCKSAYDTLVSYATNKNRRCHLELVMTKEDLRKNRHSLRWIATEYMLSDSLTKLHHNGEYLRTVLADGAYQVQVEESQLEAKRRARMRKKCGKDVTGEVFYLAWLLKQRRSK